jgi:ceramide glucosyltransferase
LFAAAESDVILAILAAVLAAIGVAQAVAGAVLVGRFADAVAPLEPRRREPPPITVLKPLHGAEPLLEQALASFCTQDYPAFQIVFGVQDAADAALAVVARLRARFPRCDIAVVVDPARHGANAKVGNLINMLPLARYRILVIADSDLHVQPDYLTRIADTLAMRGTGLATTLYTGLPAGDRLVQQLGATQITHGFLPGAVLARAMGRQDCLGATMALSRDTLAEIGGFQALLPHLADDQVLGRLVAAAGLAVRLAPTVPATTVPETNFRHLWRHELRWARTIRALEPGPFAASVLQYPIFWGLLAILLSGGAVWSFAVFLLAWVGRALAATWVDRVLEPLLMAQSKPGERLDSDPPLQSGARRETRPDDLRLEDGWKLADAARQGLAFPCPVWLLPVRDLMSVGIMVASFAGRRVVWRGEHLVADTPERPPPGRTTSKDPRPR